MTDILYNIETFISTLIRTFKIKAAFLHQSVQIINQRTMFNWFNSC